MNHNRIFYKDNFFYVIENNVIRHFYPTIVAGVNMIDDIVYSDDSGNITSDCHDIYNRYWWETSYTKSTEDDDQIKVLSVLTDRKSILTFHTESHAYIEKCCYYYQNDESITPVIFHYKGSWYISSSHVSYNNMLYDKILDIEDACITMAFKDSVYAVL